MSVELLEAKKKLTEILQGNLSRYLELLKRWCKQKINKDEFDKQTKTLLAEEHFGLHNQFIMALLLKSFIQPTKKESNPFLSDGSYANIYSQNIFDTQSIGNLSPESVLTLSFCPNDFSLPDLPSIKSRIFIHSWEHNLEECEESVEELLYFAMEDFIKNICSFLALKKGDLKRKKSVQMKDKKLKISLPNFQKPEKQFPYESSIPVLSLQKFGVVPRSDNRITLFDARDTLPLYRNVIFSHTLYSRNYERLLAQLWHP